jgi:hypothetical protein
MDYAATAVRAPSVEILAHIVAARPHPLGVKKGRGGRDGGGGAAIAKAVATAGVPGAVRRLPLTPQRAKTAVDAGASHA